MKTAWHIPYPTLGSVRHICTVVEAALGLIRDTVKAVYVGIIQILTRLFYIDRALPSSISLTARLDVIPRARHLERHKLCLGKNSLIETSSVICTWHGDVILKDGASVGIGTIVIGPVVVGEKSACSQNCFISGQSHLYQDISKNFLRQGVKTEQVVIGRNVWVCSNSVILPGVKIGDNSVIGAGSTVVDDIPAYSVVVGNPARVVKRYDHKTGQWVRV
ncbi:MAG: acyltransferase [Planctomycetota bacterium]|jgi:acetyltransferase-like isoleucine patch superfamily enzyme